MLVFSLLLSATGQKVATDGKCSTKNGHPENGGYYVTGFGWKKDDAGANVMANEDPNDKSTYGKWGVPSDDTLWTKNPAKAYPAGEALDCTPNARYGTTCTDITENFKFLTKSTCAIMRFSFADESTVHVMKDKAAFEACDFSSATKLTDGGEFTDGTNYIDFPLEQDMIDQQFYIASETGCAEGQKVALAVINEYADTYEACFDMGTETNKIQHCDCDHSIRGIGSNEVCGTGFIDGCKDQLPDDLSCCPGDDAHYVKVGMGGNYMKGGSCIPKNKQVEKMQTAQSVYDFCQDAANKETCDGYRTGDCAWYRIYNGGNWVYNTDVEGTADCDCSVEGQCTQEDGDCADCMVMNPYGGDGKKMPDGPADPEGKPTIIYGCDGDKTVYDRKCVPWYMISHCMDVDEGKEVGAGFSGDVLEKIKKDINKDECDASQDVSAYKMYSNDPDKWGKFISDALNPNPDGGDGTSSAAFAAIGMMLALRA
jgi:hypothetical protein